ncbi:hypothetical protein UI24_16515 [Mycobacteroides franklinii]|nr:hypothetical protein [Mycobacteroides franklinii]
MKCSVSYCWEDATSKEMCEHHRRQEYGKEYRKSKPSPSRWAVLQREQLAKRLEAKGFKVSETYLDQRLAGMR